LIVNSNTVYLVMPKAKSRIAGYFQLNDDPKQVPHLILNSTILVECKVLCYIVSSAVESETTRIFHNVQVVIPIRYILKQLGHS